MALYFSRHAASASRARTKGCPFGSTFGPCKEWHDTISTSSGRNLSNAATSGALQEVWPPTIAPSLVAIALLVDRV
jgi:hypothetical protein